MAERVQERELVFCYACENEWHRDEHGLECPSCHSDIVEIIDARTDPRHIHIDLTNDDDDEDEESTRAQGPDTLPHHPLHEHNPWAHDVPDPDEPDIERVSFGPGSGASFGTFRSQSPLNRRDPNGNDPFATLFQGFSDMFNGQPQGTRMGGTQTQNGLPRQTNTWTTNGPGGSRTHFSASVRVFPSGGGGEGNINMNQSLNYVQAIMQTMQASMQANAMQNQNNHDPRNNNRGQPQDPFDFLTNALFSLRNPANAAHGDAVYTEEALDRIISQMMEQAGASSAPGPASAAAIAALPKKRADKEMMGSEGKAECSVCMDNVELGDEVTVLPCKHWFHGDCVGAWLKEHDTCPHCRKGITPKEGPNDQPRSPDQQPRFNQNFPGAPVFAMGGRPPQFPGAPNGQQIPHPAMPGAFTQPGMQHPYVPGGYSAYPEPRNFVSPPQPPPHPSMGMGTPPGPGLQPPPFIPPLQQRDSQSQQWGRHSRRPSSARGSVHSHSSSGEGNSGNGGGASRVAGWFRNLRGTGNSGSGNAG